VADRPNMNAMLNASVLLAVYYGDFDDFVDEKSATLVNVSSWGSQVGLKVTGLVWDGMVFLGFVSSAIFRF